MRFPDYSTALTTDSEHSCGLFPATRWTHVQKVASAEEDEAAAEQALEELCRVYWYPVYAHLRQMGTQAHDAEDLTQGFFARVLEKGVFAAAQADRGRLRTFLLATLKAYVIDCKRKDFAAKRDVRKVISIDQSLAEERFGSEPHHNISPDVLFHRNWVATLLDQVMDALRSEWAGRQREQKFEVLEPYIPWNANDQPQGGCRCVKNQ